MKKFYFLASLPRTGSTLLASILNQNPNIHASGTSALLDLLIPLSDTINFNRKLYDINHSQEINLYRGMMNSFYDHIDKSIIFDKHRGWPRLIDPLKKMGVDNPKMLITLRPIPEIITSYITLIEKTPNEPNAIDSILNKKGVAITNENRAMTIWTDYIFSSHTTLSLAIRDHKKQFLFIQYDDIVNCPTEVLNKVHEFFEMEKFDKYDFNNITNNQIEKDETGWGIKNLHTIRPELNKISKNPENVIGKDLTKYFTQFNLKV
jgi:sulfotransferase